MYMHVSSYSSPSQRCTLRELPPISLSSPSQLHLTPLPRGVRIRLDLHLHIKEARNLRLLAQLALAHRCTSLSFRAALLRTLRAFPRPRALPSPPPLLRLDVDRHLNLHRRGVYAQLEQVRIGCLERKGLLVFSDTVGFGIVVCGDGAVGPTHMRNARRRR